MNYSKQREALFRLLRSTRSHPTAEWLYTELRKEFPNISMGTVYRNLAQLCQNGDVLRISTGDSSEHYDGFTHDHYHFVCSECDGVFDIDAVLPDELDDAVESKTGFSVDSHSVIFYGKCKSCRAAAAGKVG